jgi:hypothetical protein
MLTAKCAALEKELFREKQLAAAAARRAAAPAAACGFAAAVAASEPAVSGTVFSVYLLYWYKSTNTDVELAPTVDASGVTPDRSAHILEAVIKSGSDTDKKFSSKEDGVSGGGGVTLWGKGGAGDFCCTPTLQRGSSLLPSASKVAIDCLIN